MFYAVTGLAILTIVLTYDSTVICTTQDWVELGKFIVNHFGGSL